jgi:hypothetical protein
MNKRTYSSKIKDPDLELTKYSNLFVKFLKMWILDKNNLKE